MFFSAAVAVLATWIACARYVRSVFSRLSSQIYAFNANWNPLALRRQRIHFRMECQRLHDENYRLHKAQRIGTRIVGCLSENEIHQHHVRMLNGAMAGSDVDLALAQDYLQKIAERRKLI